MERYRRREELEAVHHVFDSLPAGIQEMLKGVHFVTGYSPRYLGLHFYECSSDGRSFDSTNHCVWTHHQLHLPVSQRHPTIVLPSRGFSNVERVKHELGHALENMLRIDNLPLPIIYPLTKYADINYYEAFATSFQAWLTNHLEKPIRGFTTREELFKKDPWAFHFFEKLNEGDL